MQIIEEEIGLMEEKKQYPHYIPLSEQEELGRVLDKYKGEVIKMFEVLCPNAVSLKRCTKNTHDIFENLYKQLTK